MSNTSLQTFRSFLTERFTAAAVEIFAEVETIVEACCQENKRLRNILRMMHQPEIKLSRIDVGQFTGANTDVEEQPPELNTTVDWEVSEPLRKKPKEEQIECDISLGLEQKELSLGSVKDDPDEQDANMPCIVDSFHIEVVECDPDTSASLWADEVKDKHGDGSSLDSDAATGGPQGSGSEESADECQEPQKHHKMSKTKKKSKRSLQRTMLELPRVMPYKIAAPSDCQSFLARLTEAFKDLPDDQKPLVTRLGLADVELVDCALGKVPRGCPLSYQCPAPSGKDYKTYDDAPQRPLLPLSYHRLEPPPPPPALSATEREHVSAMQITWEAARSLEHSTRGCKESVEELRKLRLTSCFREICELDPGRSHAEQLISKLRRGFPRRETAQVEEERRAEALREYCKQLCVNWSPCGLVVHPSAPWLGAQPDGLVYDPGERPSFGLVHVKCVDLRSFVDCGFLVSRGGVLKLKTSHSYYWHVQGEMMVTGASWCDLFVAASEDVLVQRVYRDEVVIEAMARKLHHFFFCYYLRSLVHTGASA